MNHGKNSEHPSPATPDANRRGRGRPREVIRRVPGEGLPLSVAVHTYPQTARAILDAAYRVILRDGAKAMTLVAVAREGHVDVTTVSYHFKTRVGLVEGLMDVLYREPIAAYVASLGPMATLTDRLDEYFKCVRLMSTDRDASHVYYEICTFAMRDSALRERLRRFRQWVVVAFLGVIAGDPTPQQRLAGELTWAIVDGIDLHRSLGGVDYPTEELFDLFERVIAPIWSEAGQSANIDVPDR